MKKYILVLLVPLLFLMAQCKKEAPPHVNKFTCKVNGVFWESIPRERSIFGNDLMAQHDGFDKAILVFAANDKADEVITFDINYSDSTNISNITDENPFSGSSALRCGSYNLDTTVIRQVTILEHDKVKLIIKGTFTFSAKDRLSICPNVVITDGYFDLRYQ
jgi:hypothetical protein